MDAKYIFAFLAVVFLGAALRRLARDRKINGQSRTWLLIAAIFSLVATWLFFGV